MKGALLLALVAVTHYGYGSGEDANWWFYVLRGVEGTALFLLLSRYVGGSVALVACLWGAFEEAQTAICGYMEMGNAGGVPLCLSAFGPLPYAILGAVLLVMLWRQSRHAAGQHNNRNRW